MDNKNEIKKWSKSDISWEMFVNIGIAILSAGISLFLLPYHEIWRDEGQGWIIARDTGLIDLFSVLKHEGHPFGWFLLLMPFAKSGLSCEWLGYISWFLTTLTVFFVALKAPFHPAFKALLLLNPMYIYWLPVVSRSYAPLNGLIMLLAYFYHQRRQRPILYGILMFLGANMHLMIAGIVGGILLWDVYEFWKDIRKREEKIVWKLYSGTLLGIIGCLVMVLQLVGSPETGDWNVSVFWEWYEIQKRLMVEISILFPFESHPWFMVIFINLCFIAVAIFLLFNRKKDILLIYLMEMAFVWYILLFVMPSGQKVYMLVSTVVFALWSGYEQEEMKKKKVKYTWRAVMFLLGFMFVKLCSRGYPHVIAYDIRESFSKGKETAEYLNSICNDGDVLIFVDNMAEPAITAYLKDTIKVWDITEKRYQNYPLWSNTRRENNEMFQKLYARGYQEIDGNEDGGKYTGTWMADFVQEYIDGLFEDNTPVYFILTGDAAECFIQEEGAAERYMGGFYGDCRFTGETFSIFRFVSGEND